MKEGRDCVSDVCGAVMDGVRRIDEISYAILPKDVAHALADLNKSLLNQFRELIDWKLRWNDEVLAGGDRLREEWREKCQRESTTTSDPTSQGV
ncbi:MAG TPA: hypothetical protein VFM63_07360 [Pyrinomonadaceae bacterium]|nr:hypothetical protein [Pyrinomonadaceae bacterium]